MKVNIKGITPSTISLNTIGMTIRGDSNNLKLYPESIARNISIENEDQLAELNSLINAKLVAIDVIEEKKVEKSIDASQLLSSDPVKENKPVEENKDSKDDEPKKRRGRPKGSTDKKDRKGKSGPKKVTSKVKKKDLDANSEQGVEGDSEVVVMTPDGARRGKMKNNMSGDAPESERTKASLDAMKKIEDEEKKDRDIDEQKTDESGLDLSEQMGLDAVVAGEGDEGTKVKLQNSVLPEAKQIKDRGVKFIDTEEQKLIDEKAKAAFVDNNSDDDLGFLEY